MKIATHVIFAEVFCLAFATFANVVLRPIDLVVIAVVSMLPDIDDTGTLIGKIFHPAASYIERSFGRRTITHSLLGIVILSIALAPMLFLKAKALYLLIILSVLSHIVIDCVNKEGVNLFYPAPVRAVIPSDEKNRIGEHSKAENALLYVLVGILILLFPLNRVGIKPALHCLITTPEAAVNDYMAFSSQGCRVMVDFNGVNNISQEKIKGVWEVIDLAAKNSLIIKDNNGKLYRIGNDITDNIRPVKIRAIKGKRQYQATQKIILKNNILRDILFAVPSDSEAYISGYIKTDGAIPARKDCIDSYQAIKQSSNKIELSSATIAHLTEMGLLDTFAEEGQIIIRTIYPDSELAHASSRNEITLGPSNTIVIIVKEIKDRSDILVKEGDKITKGQILAILHEKRDLKLIELNKAVSILTAAKSELRALKAKITSELKEKELEDAILGIRRELKQLKASQTQGIQKAYHKVYICHLAVKKTLASLKSFETPSPCDGRVASIAYQDQTAKIMVVENGK
jgi:Predicted membrane-bound metal-dependent hydrolases